MHLPYLTSDFPGIGGSIKRRAEDFFVQEVPLYEPSGEGEHVYFEIQKQGVTTFDAVGRVAKALNVSSRDVGYAGMKDARAVTRQVFSVAGPGITEEAVMALKWPDLAVQWAARHGNKLRLGHLAGNRFAIKIRDVDPTSVVKLTPVLQTIEKRGLPNYFGEQRFGRRNNNDLLGAALVRSDNVGVLKLLLGSPDPSVDDPQTQRARKAFDERDNDLAMKIFPRHHGMERRVLARLIKTQKPGNAVREIDEKIRRLWVSALQSRLFNDVVARRVSAGTYDKVVDGDVAMKHENGACFPVEDAAKEQPRAEAFEISATGPLVGYRMTVPTGAPGEAEHELLGKYQLTPEAFRQQGRLRVKGARRSLRVKPTDIAVSAGVDEHGSHVTVAFTLPSGSFATVLIGELMKPELHAGKRAKNEQDVDESEDEGDDNGDGDPDAGEPSTDSTDE